MSGAEPFPLDRTVLPALGPLFDSEPQADGQHEGRVGKASRRRVRSVHARAALALFDDGFPQPPAAISGVSRLRRPLAKGVSDLEEDVSPLSASADVQESEAA